MTIFRTETVDTPAGTYTVELHSDEDSENPLTNWDHDGMAFYTHGHQLITNDTMDDAGRAGDVLRQLISDYNQDNVTRRYAKWAAITGSPWVLVADSDSSSQSDFYRWYVLVDHSYGDFDMPADPTGLANAVMSDYRTWAAGEVCGFVTKSPDGEDFDSTWGFYDDDEALEQGKDAAKHDALGRIDQANRAGAGIIGII